MLAAALVAGLLGGCGSSRPVATNEAVSACIEAAKKASLAPLDQSSVTPLGEGRYAIVLIVGGKNGNRQAKCAYDPAKGARIAPPQ